MLSLVAAGLATLTREGAVEHDSVQIRPVEADDAAEVARFVRELSPLSKQRRFHAGIRELSPDLLLRFTRPRLDQECVLLAMAIEDGDEVCIGEARYALADDGAQGHEFALAVADRWQGRGIGRRLLCALRAQADRRGIDRLHGDVLRDNLPMLALASRLGFTVRRHPADPRLLRVVRPRGVRPTADGCAPWPRRWPAGRVAHFI